MGLEIHFSMIFKSPYHILVVTCNKCSWALERHSGMVLSFLLSLYKSAVPVLLRVPADLSHYSCQQLISNFFFLMVRQPLGGQGRLSFRGFTITHILDTPHSVGLLWTRDQPDAETSTRQHTTLTRDRHRCTRRESNPQSQQVSGRRPTP
jgi:hypothetical protein